MPCLAGLRSPFYRHDLIERALAESGRRLNAKIFRRWEAEDKTGANVRYIGLVLEAAATD